MQQISTLENSIGTEDEAGEGSIRRHVVAFPRVSALKNRRPGDLIGRARGQGTGSQSAVEQLVSSISSIYAA